MPKPIKKVNDADELGEEYKGDAELEGELDGDAVLEAITTESDDIDFNRTLGIDKDMDSFDDKDPF
ncbi:MAG: hypothetical protein WCO84_03940 [bacterium]